MISHQTSIKPQPNKRLEARTQLEDIMFEMSCLAELIGNFQNEFQLSENAVNGLVIILRGIHERGRQALEELDFLERKEGDLQ